MTHAPIEAQDAETRLVGCFGSLDWRSSITLHKASFQSAGIARLAFNPSESISLSCIGFGQHSAASMATAADSVRAAADHLV